MTTISTMPFYKVLMRTTVASHPPQILLRDGSAHHSSPPSPKPMRTLSVSHIMEPGMNAVCAARIQCVPRRTHATTGHLHLLLLNIHLQFAHLRHSDQLRLSSHTLGLSQLAGLPPCTALRADPRLQIPALTTVTTQLLLGRQRQGQQTLPNHPSPSQEPQKWSPIETPADKGKTLRVEGPPALAQGGPQPTWSSGLPVTLQGRQVITSPTSPINLLTLLC